MYAFYFEFLLEYWQMFKTCKFNLLHICNHGHLQGVPKKSNLSLHDRVCNKNSIRNHGHLQGFPINLM